MVNRSGFINSKNDIIINAFGADVENIPVAGSIPERRGEEHLEKTPYTPVAFRSFADHADVM